MVSCVDPMWSELFWPMLASLDEYLLLSAHLFVLPGNHRVLLACSARMDRVRSLYVCLCDVNWFLALPSWPLFVQLWPSCCTYSSRTSHSQHPTAPQLGGAFSICILYFYTQVFLGLLRQYHYKLSGLSDNGNGGGISREDQYPNTAGS